MSDNKSSTIDNIEKQDQAKLEFFKNTRVENEQKMLSYLMRNHMDSASIEDKYFLHPVSKAIFYGIKQVHEKGLHFDLDTVFTIGLDKFKFLTYEIISDIKNKFNDFENITFVKETLHNDYLKNNIKDRILKELWPRAVQADYLKLDDLKIFTEELMYDLTSLTNSGNLLTGQNLADDHKAIIADRDSGLTIRTMGFRCLDECLTKPAAAAQITILAGQKGHGKTTYAKTIENRLIDKKVCVLSIHLEMSQEDSTDSMLCIRKGIPLKVMNEKDMNDGLKTMIMEGLDEIASIPNYLFLSAPTITVPEIGAAIQNAKNIFRSAGVLPEDEYIFVVLDSIDLAEGFDEPLDIKRSIIKLGAEIKKHGSHLLALVQMGEDKIRNKHFKDPEELDTIRFTYSDIYGGSYYAARARVVFCLNRPLVLKKQFFPEREEEWSFEHDMLMINIAKQNAGDISGHIKFLFEGPKMKITPFMPV